MLILFFRHEIYKQPIYRNSSVSRNKAQVIEELGIYEFWSICGDKFTTLFNIQEESLTVIEDEELMNIFKSDDYKSTKGVRYFTFTEKQSEQRSSFVLSWSFDIHLWE